MCSGVLMMRLLLLSTALAGAAAQSSPFPSINQTGTLELGIPKLGFSEPGSPSFFTVPFNASRQLQLYLTPLSGNVDLYVSAVDPKPKGDEWSGGSSDFSTHLYTSDKAGLEADSVTIEARALCGDAGACPEEVHVGVVSSPLAVAAALFQLTATQLDTDSSASSGTAVTLSAGLPLDGSLAETEEAHYMFVVPNASDDTVLTLTVITAGDPDLYVSVGPALSDPAEQQVWPTATSGARWSGNAFGGERLLVPAAELREEAAGSCEQPSGCALFLSVVAYSQTGRTPAPPAHERGPVRRGRGGGGERGGEGRGGEGALLPGAGAAGPERLRVAWC